MAGDLAAAEVAGVEPKVEQRELEVKGLNAVAGEVQEPVVEGFDEPGGVACGEEEGVDRGGTVEEECLSGFE